MRRFARFTTSAALATGRRSYYLDAADKSGATREHEDGARSSSRQHHHQRGVHDPVLSRSVADLKKELESISLRLENIEREHELDALVAFYCTIPKVEIDLDEVVNKCEDPTYNQFLFCHRQLPVLIARLIKLIDSFPLGLNTMPSIRRVRKIFAQSFYSLHSCELPITPDTEKTFYLAVEERDQAHDEILMTMANGVLELKHSLIRHKKAINALNQRAKAGASTAVSPSRSARARSNSRSSGGNGNSSATSSSATRIEDIFNSKTSQPVHLADANAVKKAIVDDLQKIQAPLDEFNSTMVEYRFLSRQMLQTMRNRVVGLAADPDEEVNNDVERIGMVTKDLDLVKLVKSAVQMAKEICDTHYGDSPDVDVIVAHKTSDEPVKISHLGDNIYYIIGELMKNALRATVEHHMKRNSSGIVTCLDMPAIRVVISLRDDKEEAVVCISDEGGGIRREDMRKVMSYTYTTSSKAILETENDGDDPTPLAGYGYGLPMSRIYARCFGGDVDLQSVEGFGTKAYFFLKKRPKRQHCS